MKAAQKTKLVSLTTALGVFLVGCGGGPNNEATRTVTGVSTSGTGSIPSTIIPVTSSGSGSTGLSSNDTTEQIYAQNKSISEKVTAMDAKVTETLAKAKQGKDWAKIGGIAALALGGLFAMNRVNSMNSYRKATEEAGEKAGFFKSLWKGGIVGDRGDSIRSETNLGKHSATMGAVGGLKTDVQTVQNTAAAGLEMSATALETSEKAETAAKGAETAARASQKEVVKVFRAVELSEQNDVVRHKELMKQMDTKMNIIAANVVAFSSELKDSNKTLTDEHKAKFEALKKDFQALYEVIVAKDTTIESSKELAKKLDELSRLDLTTKRLEVLTALEATKNAYEKALQELSKVKVIEVAKAGSAAAASPAAAPAAADGRPVRDHFAPPLAH